MLVTAAASGPRPGLVCDVVRDRPAGVTDRELGDALADGWRIEARALRYAAVGGGSYHWAVRDGHRDRWFVTVDDLDSKGWLGETRPAVFAGLATAMDTAVSLRRDAGLRFVAAPVKAHDGGTLRPLGSRYAVAVFPFLRGAAGRFGEAFPARDRRELVDMLAALHQATPTADAPKSQVGLPRRDALDTALRELHQPWHGGPFAEPARALMTRSAPQVGHLLEYFDERAAEVTADARTLVITHGEPHPGNIIQVGAEKMLVDWDTVAFAPPERDLWIMAGATGDELRRYTEITGLPVDAAVLGLYRLRWALDDISISVAEFRSRHRRTADTELAWLSLQSTVERITRPTSPA